MKTIEQIAKEFIEIVNSKEEFDSIHATNDPCDRFSVYYDINGFYNDDYFDVIFFKKVNERAVIDIAHTTDYPEKIVKIILGIEPKAGDLLIIRSK